MVRERPPIRSVRPERANTNLLLKKKLLAKAIRNTRTGVVKNAVPRRLPNIVTNPVPAAVRKTKTATEAASGAQKGWRKLYVGDLDEATTENDLQRDFGEFGKIVDIWVARNPPGFAFIDFKESTDAARALRVMDGSSRLGDKIKVEFAKKLGPKTSSALAFARKRMTAQGGQAYRSNFTGRPPRRLPMIQPTSSQRQRRPVRSLPASQMRSRGSLSSRGRGKSFPVRDRGSFSSRDRGSYAPRRSPPPVYNRIPDRGRSPPRAPGPRYPPRRSVSPPPRRANYHSPPPIPPLPALFNPADPRFREMAMAGGWRGRSPVNAPPLPPHSRYYSRSPSPRSRPRSPPPRSPARFGRPDRARIGRGRGGRDGHMDRPFGREGGGASLVYPPLNMPPPSFMKMPNSPPRRMRSPPPSPPPPNRNRPPIRDRSPLRRSPPMRMPMPQRSPPPLPPMGGRSPGMRGGRIRSPPPRRRTPPMNRPMSASNRVPVPRYEMERKSYRGDISPPPPRKTTPGTRRYISPPRLQERNKGPPMNYDQQKFAPQGRRISNSSWDSPSPMKRNRSPPVSDRSPSPPMHRTVRSPPPSPPGRAWSPHPGHARRPRSPHRNLKGGSPSNGGRYQISPPQMKRSYGGGNSMSMMSQMSMRNAEQSRPRTPPRGYTPPARSRSPPRYMSSESLMMKTRSPPPLRPRSPPMQRTLPPNQKMHANYNRRR